MTACSPAWMLPLLLLACGRSHAVHVSEPVDAGAEAAKLVPFLPARFGAFAAAGPATSHAIGGVIDAERSYSDGGGRTVHVHIMTGDTRSYAATLDSDDEHAFGSDSPTYWRTTSIAGRRARIAEERPKPVRSECVVRAGPNHVADVRVSPAAAGDCERVAALLDYTGIAATGGVPSPAAVRR